MMAEDPQQISPERFKEEAGGPGGRIFGGSRGTRLTATLVLIATVPMLLLSGLVLILFYVSPTRFESLLAHLPGEAAIRTVLIFAPVTLLAIIVLALLYAFEKPTAEVTRPQVVRVRESRRESLSLFAQLDVQRFAWWILLLTSFGLLFLVPVRSAAFLSPELFERFLSRFPGERLLSTLVHWGPLILLIIVMIAVAVFIGARMRRAGGEREVIMPGMRWLRKVGPARLAVVIVLTFSLPILLLSLASLFLFFTRAEVFLKWISGLSGEIALRMGLIFIPASLIIVVVLALLFLIKGRSEAEALPGHMLTTNGDGSSSWDVFLWYLSWIFVWTIAQAGSTILGLIMGMGVLLLR
jgi:hypothetical protein